MHRKFKEMEQKFAQVQKDYIDMTDAKQRMCTHGVDSNAETVPLHNSGVYPRKVTDKYTDTAVVCKRCKQIYESNNFTSNQLGNTQYINRSILEQIKHVANLPDADWDMIGKAYEALAVIDQIHVYYLDMIEKMTSGGNKKGNKSRKKENLFGVDSSMFGGRSY